MSKPKRESEPEPSEEPEPEQITRERVAGLLADRRRNLPRDRHIEDHTHIDSNGEKIHHVEWEKQNGEVETIDANLTMLLGAAPSTSSNLEVLRIEAQQAAEANDADFQTWYEAAFGSHFRARVVVFLNWLQAQTYTFESAWNSPFVTRVKDVISIPVLAEGGIRSRAQMDHLLGTRMCDLVGMSRPFYAEPRIAARMLTQSDENIHTACENCNNCTVPQVTRARGICRTPSVLQKKGQLKKKGAYER